MTYIPSRTFHCRLPNSEKYIQLGKYYRVETEDVKRCRARIIELEMSGEYEDEKYIFEKVNGFKFEITNYTKGLVITEIDSSDNQEGKCMLKVGDKLMYEGKVATVRYYDGAGVYVSEASISEGLFDMTWQRAYESAWEYQKQQAEKALKEKEYVINNTKTISKKLKRAMKAWDHLKVFLEDSKETEVDFYTKDELVGSCKKINGNIKISAVLREMDGLERFIR